MPQSQKDWYGKCVAVAIKCPESGLIIDQISIRNPSGNDWDVYSTEPDKNMASGPKCEDDLAYCSNYNSISVESPHHIA
jgi:hypothetical protein